MKIKLTTVIIFFIIAIFLNLKIGTIIIFLLIAWIFSKLFPELFTDKEDEINKKEER